MYLKDGVVNDPRYSTKEPLRPGVVKYKDQDGDGKITTKDRTVIGSAIPKWYGGITNTLNYKGLTSVSCYNLITAMTFIMQPVYIQLNQEADVEICWLK